MPNDFINKFSWMQNAILQGKTIIFKMELKIIFKELYDRVVFEKKLKK